MFQFTTCEFNERRADVYPFHRAIAYGTLHCIRRAHQQRNAHRAVEEVALIDKPIVAVHLTVVGTVDDDGVFKLAARLNYVKDFANLRVNECDVACVIGA